MLKKVDEMLYFIFIDIYVEIMYASYNILFFS